MVSPILLLSVLVLGAVAAYAPLPERRIRELGIVFMSAASLIAALIAIPGFASTRFFGPSETWYIDGLAALVVLMIAVVSLTATFVSHRYLSYEHQAGIVSLQDIRLYYFCLPIFVGAMYAAVMANNAGIMWIALESTTLATTLLVSFYRKRSAIEAAWKYVILCSLGISLGLVGVILTAAAVSVEGSEVSFVLSNLRSAAETGIAQTTLLKFAFVFLLIGIGTKIGFVPMHTWLPDAHSKTPSPISALLSGVLLNVAFVSLLRFKFITDAALADNGAWTGMLLMIFGLLSIFVPGLIMLRSNNYKRLLAYSSIEHMGLLAFASGLGPAGLIPAFMHMPAHALAKSSMFYGAGEILAKYKTTESNNIHDIGARYPTLACLFILSLLGLLAIPPSGLFASELIMIGYGLQEFTWPTLLMLLGLVIVMAAMMRHVINMLWGETSAPSEKEPFNITYLMIAIHLVLLAALGVWSLTPPGLEFVVGLVSSTNPASL